MLNRIFVSTLLVLSVSLFISCKSSKKSSANPEDTVEPTTNSNAIEEENTSSTSSFLDQDCETTWSNFVALFPVNKTFGVESPRVVNSSSLVTEEFVVKTSSDSGISVDKTNFTGNNQFFSHWGVNPPQYLESKSIFINQCNELKNIINNNLYNAEISEGTVSLSGTSYDAISLTLKPSSDQINNFSGASVFAKFNFISSRLDKNPSYNIVFTQSHMFIQKRIYKYTKGTFNPKENTVTSTVNF